jgi:hypothetical protein
MKMVEGRRRKTGLAESDELSATTLSKSPFTVNPKIGTSFKHLDHGANYL